MPTNHTPSYSLSQWERSDKVQMEDFNSDNAKIDTALRTQADGLAAEIRARTALAALTATKGNCRIETLSYTGTGECGPDHPNTLTFSGRPAFFLGFGGQAVLFYTRDCGSITSLHNGGYNYHLYSLNTSWNGNTVSWYSDNMVPQANEKMRYFIAAFYIEG